MSRSSAFIISVIRAARNWVYAAGGRLSGLKLSILADAAFCAAALFAGCTDASIARARHEIASGDYRSAHQHLAAEAAKADQLSPSARRAVMDGLCLTEYQIGPPTYSLMRQLRTCATALNEPGSESGQMFAELSRKERDSLTKQVTAALAHRDIAGAEDAILRYRSTPGSNPQLAAVWTRRLWTIVNRDAMPERTSLTATISQISRQFRPQQNMSARQFHRWIEQNMTVDGNLMVSEVEVGKRTLDLWLGDNQLSNAAVNLDRFARVNDGLVARCH
ncbi:MAG: hypothetical protein JO166_05170, partial [Deltaproteobacteria bacterium]|nr:hypothetical protein [Deltaproteobacteria bacterium]